MKTCMLTPRLHPLRCAWCDPYRHLYGRSPIETCTGRNTQDHDCIEGSTCKHACWAPPIEMMTEHPWRHVWRSNDSHSHSQKRFHHIVSPPWHVFSGTHPSVCAQHGPPIDYLYARSTMDTYIQRSTSHVCIEGTNHGNVQCGTSPLRPIGNHLLRCLIRWPAMTDFNHMANHKLPSYLGINGPCKHAWPESAGCHPISLCTTSSVPHLCFYSWAICKPTMHTQPWVCTLHKSPW